MSPYARKVDSTHAEVVQAFRAMGWTVLQTFRLGQDAPDLVCARAGRTVSVEVKGPRGKLTAGQRAWRAAWPGETAIVRSVADVQALTRG